MSHEPGATEACGPGEGPDPRQTVEQLKAEGGRHFRSGNLEEALACYASALQNLERSGLADLTLQSTLSSNQALCYLKLSRFQEAEESASAALAADASNSKAVYRRGLSRLNLGDPRGAVEDLQKALRLEPQNAEVRQKLSEAKQQAEEAPIPESEMAVASGATSALGKDGGLYSEKLDLNEGRLAQSFKEQRDWVNTIDNWMEIKDISFVDEEDKNVVSVYMSLPGLHEIAANKVCVWLTATTLEVRVVELRGANWCYVAQELWGQIDPQQSTWKVRRDKLSIKLQKRASARSWDRWEKIRRI
ncbi:UNC45A [Symbiodinium natans]|uniref:UNC45A protein n=1 Tax=Symbiodinium natans TaxID=878477 RepID=A0A812GZQ2_9DINO|nr:UNC45A [Symbiodinium natans]